VTVALTNRATAHASQAELSPVGWSAGAELAYDEWLHQGARLGLAGRSAAWWIGDWVRYGTARYGSKYAGATRVTGYDRQTLMNMVYVATRFQISRRRENLSWSHHAELAARDIEEQERWLNHATAERLSVRDLRDLLQPDRRPAARSSSRRGAALSKKPPASTPERAPVNDRSHERVVVCPHCGHRFVSEAVADGGENQVWPA
jgi:hypothetical protein